MEIRCYTCHETKDEEKFHRRSEVKSGRSRRCKECTNEYFRRYRSKYDPAAKKRRCSQCESELIVDENWPSTRAKNMQCICNGCIAVRSRRYRTNDPAAHLFRLAKQRAERAGIPFSITQSDIVVPIKCPVLGIKLVVGEGRMRDSSPSVDRLIPSVGYVPGNISVISMKANRMKNDASLEELKLLVDWLECVSGE